MPPFDGSVPSASDFWVELFRGAYRVVDWYDRGGRRYVVAARRASCSVPQRLTPRQERALRLRASGQALKVIAVELGVSLSTAARDLERALELVGLGSEANLAAILGALARPGSTEAAVAHA